MIDQYVEAPPRGWPAWMRNELAEAASVLMICTETYHRRVTGGEQPGSGLGATWEGALITQAIYEDGGRNMKFIPVVFSSSDIRWIPSFVAATTRYDLGSEHGYERLYRRLTSQPLIVPPELGALRPLPPLPKVVDRSDTPLVKDLLLVWDLRNSSETFSLINVDIGPVVEVTVDPSGPASAAFLSATMKSNDTISLAFGETVLLVRPDSVARSRRGSREEWVLRFKPEERNYGSGLTEAGTRRYSADDIAQLRARRILLNEPVPASGDETLLPSLVEGINSPVQVTQSPLPALWARLAADRSMFVAVARLVAIMWLILSGTIEHVLQLDLALEGDTLHIDFRGVRRKIFSNQDPPQIIVKGVLPLEQVSP